MEDFADKIKAMLSDPEGVEKIMGIARALGENMQGESEKSPAPPPKPESPAGSPPSPSGGLIGGLLGGEDNPVNAILKNPELKRLFGSDCKRRNELLRAIHPFLSEEKRLRLDRIIKATSTIETVYAAGSFLT